MRMKPSPHLKDRAHYEDLYDRDTVEICREREESLCRPPPGVKATKQEIKRENNKIWPKTLRDISLWYEAGARYAKREETINKWIESDRRRDEQLEKAVLPENITCRACDTSMYEEIKFLLEPAEGKEEQVLFFFRCPKCKNGRGIFEDGTEWQRPHPGTCKKCNIVLTSSHKRKGDQAITISCCRRCGYEKREVLDLRPAKKLSAAEERRFVRDRKRFCFSKEKGEQYTKRAHFPPTKINVQTTEDRYLRDAARQLKKISIVSIEKILKAALSKEGYIRLRLQPPEMERDVIVKFAVHDKRSEREEHTSRYSLQHCIDAALSETNWRLMSDGVHYRLGVLQGRLRGYEREEDLMKLIQAREKKNE